LWKSDYQTIKKKVNSSQNEGLSPSCIDDLAQYHGTVFGFSALVQFSQFFSRISNVFGLSTTEETYKVVEMRIWCIKIGVVLVLHIN
jgi:hypothetical protein